MFGHDWDPQYYVNPPAYTYLVHLLLGAWYGGRAGVSQAFATDPTQIWIARARRSSAVLGTLAVWLLYLAGTRLVDRRVGLLVGRHLHGRVPAGLLLQARAQRRADAGAAVPGAVGRGGRPALRPRARLRHRGDRPRPGVRDEVHRRDRAAAARRGDGRAVHGAGRPRRRGARHRDRGRRRARRVPRSPTRTRCSNWDAFIERPDAPVRRLRRRGRQARAHAGQAATLYYLWSFGWGLGWIPLLFAVGGAVRLWFDERRLVWVLVPAVARLRALHGLAGALLRALAHAGLPVRLHPRGVRGVRARRLGRALLAGAEADVRRRARSSRSARRASSTRCTRASCCRARTRATSPATGWSRTSRSGTKIVVEPVVPDQWAQDIGNAVAARANGNRWVKYPTSKSAIDPKTGKPSCRGAEHAREHRGLREASCRPSSSRRSSSRATAGSSSARRSAGARRPSRSAVPQALAYYRELERAPKVAHEVSPYSKGKGPVKFNFDWTFDYYPLAYNRPGPVMTIYRLHGRAVRDRRAAADLSVRAVWRVGRMLPGVSLLTAADHEHLERAIELARVRPRPRASEPDGRRGARARRGRARRGLARGVRRRRTPRSTRSPPPAGGRPARARRSTSRWSRAATRQDAAVHRRDPRGRHRARRRRLRRPQREGRRAAGSGSCATRASTSRSPTARSRGARGSSTRPSASTPAPAARGCCSSPR